MEHIARREKDVIKNDFARLGLFEAREAKFVCRKLNRFFTTHTFNDNFPIMKTDEITKFVIENSLMDLLPERFIDLRYVKLLLDNLDVIYMRDELILIEKMAKLMSPDTDLGTFLEMVNVTTDYICKADQTFNRNGSELKLVTETLKSLPASEFDKISDVNQFTQNLKKKLEQHDQKLPSVEELLEKFLSINLGFIQEEFKNVNTVSFDDQKLSSTYADTLRLSYINCVNQSQSAFGTFLLIKDIIKNFMTISRTQILIGCEEVAKLSVEDPQNRELLAHVVTFLEIFSVDSRNLRCFLLLKKMNANKGSDFNLHDSITSIETESDLSHVEALEVIWSVRKVKEPTRSYLNGYLASNDWFRIVLMAQYLNFSLNSLVSICDRKVPSKSMADSVIRAVLYESSPEFKKRCSFTKKRLTKSNTTKNVKRLVNLNLLNFH